MKTRICGARGKFAAMVGTYSLGVFNDNFFKIAVLLLAVGRPALKFWVNTLFMLPFILLAAPAGWMADRFAKRTVVILAKVLELLAMLCGAAGIITGSWPLVMVMVVLMATQSTIFSPSLNGSIPELYPAEYVPKANAALRVIITAAILLGTATAGIALNSGRVIVGIVVVTIAALGVVVSFSVPRRRPANPEVAFPWSGLWHTLRDLWRIREDRLLAFVLAADVFVWSVGALEILILQDLSQLQFRWGEAVASYLIFAEMAGIAIGGVVAPWIASHRRWYRVLPVMAVAISALAALVPFVPLVPEGFRRPGLYVTLVLMGVAGGIILVPCESFIQVRPAPQRKGAVWAAGNCAVFTGMLISGGVYFLLATTLKPTDCFAAVGGISLVAGAGLYLALRRRADEPD